jgi:putative ABC transport system ATP-binding protein
MAKALIETIGLCKDYRDGVRRVRALDGVTLRINEGEFVAITGPSGSGKSTFMYVIGCLATPSEGLYRFDGIALAQASRADLARIRNERLGFVFQSFNLLPRSKVLDNVELPMIYAGRPRYQRRQRAIALLRAMGLEHRIDHRASELSGGEQQRVAIARAIVNRPKLLLADEPTGALDSRTGAQVMALFQQLNRDGTTIVLVTHDPGVAGYAHRALAFRDGRMVADGQSGCASPVPSGIAESSS